MRLWTVHPRFLDTKGLAALWREGLLAQAALAGRTRGYRSHPQLLRFREQPEPLRAIAAYLEGVWEEGIRRGWRLDRRRIGSGGGTCPGGVPPIPETSGQLAVEWEHLLGKLRARSPELAASLAGASPEPHPLFVIVPGDVRPWEKPGR